MKIKNLTLPECIALILAATIAPAIAQTTVYIGPKYPDELYQHQVQPRHYWQHHGQHYRGPYGYRPHMHIQVPEVPVLPPPMAPNMRYPRCVDFYDQFRRVWVQC